MTAISRASKRFAGLIPLPQYDVHDNTRPFERICRRADYAAIGYWVFLGIHIGVL